MKRVLAVLLITLVAATVALGQTSGTSAVPSAPSSATPAPTPTPAPNTGVRFSEETATFPLQGGGVANAITVRLPFTGHWSGVVTDFQIPGEDAITVAGAEYRTTLAKLFGKSSGNAQVNLKKFHVYARLQLGSEVEAATGKHNFATYVGGGIEYPLGVIAGLKTYGGINLGRLDLPYTGSHYIMGSQNQVSPHVTFNF